MLTSQSKSPMQSLLPLPGMWMLEEKGWGSENLKAILCFSQGLSCHQLLPVLTSCTVILPSLFLPLIGPGETNAHLSPCQPMLLTAEVLNLHSIALG